MSEITDVLRLSVALSAEDVAAPEGAGRGE